MTLTSSGSLKSKSAPFPLTHFACHWKPTDSGSADYTHVGWYENTFGRIDGEWKITRLLHTYQAISRSGAGRMTGGYMPNESQPWIT